MDAFTGKVAFVTGAAGGIGLAIARAFARESMSVMMADIDGDLLDEKVREIRAEGGDVAGMVCDVGKAADVFRGAQETLERFGRIHVLVNNAGVSVEGIRAGKVPPEDWQWIVNVNLLGVAYGVEAFLPVMQEQGEGGHIVNTASIAGHFGVPALGPYNATKAAVIAYSESMAAELKDQNIGVSVLCPAVVKSRIHLSRRNHPEADLREVEETDRQKKMMQTAMDADRVAQMVLRAIRQNELYIFTHKELLPVLEARHRRIIDAYKHCNEQNGTADPAPFGTPG